MRLSQSNYLPAKNFQLSADKLAEKLLGTYLVSHSEEGTTIGQIVETEAYLGNDDPASHSARGRTPRNEAMFLPGGHAYIYFIYGMYFCFNVVSGKSNHGEAVLIRALRPIEGLHLMESRLIAHRKRRRSKSLKHIPETQLCNGPGKLVIAMGIKPEQNGEKINGSSLLILKRDKPVKIATSSRIGISSAQELKLRFHLEGSDFVSR